VLNLYLIYIESILLFSTVTVINTQRNNHVKSMKIQANFGEFLQNIVKIPTNFVNFHKILLKFTKIRMDFKLTNFFGEFYMIISLSEFHCDSDGKQCSINPQTY
jgi:hypothetical protein